MSGNHLSLNCLAARERAFGVAASPTAFLISFAGTVPASARIKFIKQISVASLAEASSGYRTAWYSLNNREELANSIVGNDIRDIIEKREGNV